MDGKDALWLIGGLVVGAIVGWWYANNHYRKKGVTW